MPQQQSNDYIKAADPSINAAVAAAAGTGKTWLLTTRLLRLLLAGAHPGSILAITFTEKAAAEMYERLHARVRLWSTLSDEQLDGELNLIGQKNVDRKLRRQAQNLYEKLLYAENSVQVMTFHAFCRKMLERFPSYSGVPAGFGICEDSYELQALAVERLMEDAVGASALRQNLDLLSQCCDGLYNLEKALLSFLNHRTDWLSYTQGQAEAVDYACQQLQRTLNTETTKDTVALTEVQAEPLKKWQDFFATAGEAGRKRATIIAHTVRQEELDLPALRELKNVFYYKKGNLRPISKKQLQGLDDQQEQELLSLHQQILAWLSQAEDQLLAHDAWQRNRAWYAAGQHTAELYQQLKQERHVLDFNDLEWHARQLIANKDYAPWVVYCLNERIRHILVDEFQDTNPDQWQLLKPFLEEIKAGGDGSVLIVGDTKQSIFGFRRANPKLQACASEWIQHNMDGQTYTMDQSRRSAPAIMQFVNKVFQPTGDEKLPLLADFNQSGTVLETAGKVYCLPFCTEDEKKQRLAGRAEHAWRAILKTPVEEKKRDLAHQEGKHIATAIQQLIEQGLSIQPADGRSRAIAYSDILILLRRTTKLSYLQSALRCAGIPFSSSHEENLLQSSVAHDVLALLKLLLNPNDNLALAQVLRSPMFGIDDQRLMTLAQGAARGSYYQQLEKLAGGDSQWQTVYQQIKQWIARRDRQPAHDVLSYIYHSQDLVARYRMLMHESRREQSEQALYALLEYTLSFDSGRWPSLQSFARELERQLTRGVSSQSEPSIQHRNQLRIMTVHKAKGLEAPVVFLADCGAHQKPVDSYRALLEWDVHEDRPQEFMLLPRVADSDLLAKRCLDKQKEKDRIEEMNLLYVALTRARQYLFISGHGKKQSSGGWYHLICKRAQPEMFAYQSGQQKAAAQQQDKPHWSIQTPIHFELNGQHEELSPSRLGATQTTSDSWSDLEDDDRLTRGQAIHRALELLSNKYQQAQIVERLSQDFSLLKDKEIMDYYQQAQAVYRDERFAELFNDARFERVYNEMPLSYQQSERYYYGVIDRLCVAERWIWLIDYKTHRGAEKKINELAELYKEQMQAYRDGVEKLWPHKQVRMALLFTSVPVLYEYPS